MLFCKIEKKNGQAKPRNLNFLKSSIHLKQFKNSIKIDLMFSLLFFLSKSAFLNTPILYFRPSKNPQQTAVY